MSQELPLIAWSEEYRTGNELIDTQHQMLVLLCRKLELAYASKMDHRIIVGLCLELKKFADFHFLSEENVMREVGYPGLDRHAQSHSHLLFELDVWIQKVNHGSEAPAALLGVVARWIVGHIRTEDMRLAEYIPIAGTRALAEGEYGLYLRQPAPR